MPPLRDWPVCWLFLLATAAVDAVMLQGATGVPWAAGLAVGQMMLLGLYIVHSRLHRLLRGALFVAGLGGLSWLAVVVMEPYFFPRWFALLAATLAVQSTVAVAAATTAWAGRRCGTRAAAVARDDRWQYPLIEIFGWTIVVAAASVLLRDAALAPLLTNAQIAVFWLTGCLVAGVCGSLCYEFRRWPPTVLVPALLLSPGIFWLVWNNMQAGEASVMLAAQLYLATFLLCRWLDISAGHGVEPMRDGE